MTDVKPPNHDCLFKGEPEHDRLKRYCDTCYTGYDLTINNHSLECPYCGYHDRNAWEWCREDEEKHECGNCGLIFLAEQCVMVDYRGHPLPEEERNPCNSTEEKKPQ
jgi:predicted RNA-binding Zn-ribbon protein involved in translation (DUF1610 family)